MVLGDGIGQPGMGLPAAVGMRWTAGRDLQFFRAEVYSHDDADGEFEFAGIQPKDPLRPVWCGFCEPAPTCCVAVGT